MERSVDFDPKHVLGLTGVELGESAIRNILSILGFKVNNKNFPWKVIPPPWRNDIDGSADLVEEVIRIHGYENIPELKLINENVVPKPAISRERKRFWFLKRMLAGRGLIEAITYSFMSSKNAKLFNGGTRDLCLINPISDELDCMRPSLIPNLLEAASQNIKRGENNSSIFEMGPIFLVKILRIKLIISQVSGLEVQ